MYVEKYLIASNFVFLPAATYFTVRPRFFDQVGHETMYAPSGNKHFTLNLVIVRPTKIMNRADKNCGHI